MFLRPQRHGKTSIGNIFPLNLENTPCPAHFQPEKCSFQPVPGTHLRSTVSIAAACITAPKSNFPSKMFLQEKSFSMDLQQLRQQQTPLPLHYTADRNRSCPSTSCANRVARVAEIRHKTGISPIKSARCSLVVAVSDHIARAAATTKKRTHISIRFRSYLLSLLYTFYFALCTIFPAPAQTAALPLDPAPARLLSGYDPSAVRPVWGQPAAPEPAPHSTAVPSRPSPPPATTRRS